MHAVEHYELIRRKHFVDGMSQRAIAEELGHSRKFVKKALAHPIPSGSRPTKDSSLSRSLLVTTNTCEQSKLATDPACFEERCNSRATLSFPSACEQSAQSHGRRGLPISDVIK